MPVSPCKLFFLFLLLSVSGFAQTSVIEQTHTILLSPNKNFKAEFYQVKEASGKKEMFYKVFFKNKPVVLESKLDLQLDNHLMESAMGLKVDKQQQWFDNLTFKTKTTVTKDTSWKPVHGERSLIKDHYNEAVITFFKEDNPHYQLQIQFRAYDAGIAFRYYFPEDPTGVYDHITSENTEFTLPENTKAFFTSWGQGKHQVLPLKNWPDQSERPLTLQLQNGLYACLTEAQMTDYARAKFKLSTEKPNTLITSLYGGVDQITYFGTPWRVIMAGEKAGDLIENENLIQNLNPPNEIKTTDWIRPGKIKRQMSLTTEGALEDIDFAAAHHLQYILFDWKWYGPPLTFNSDATQVKAPIDLKKVVDYGRSKNIGVWLYVNLQALVKQEDELFPLYHQWGIKGVKFGFVQVGSQRWTAWLIDAIKKAAANELMVDVHDDYRPTGEDRTYPNLMTAEGVRGNEEFPDATHNTILPFTRYIAGPADYTICYYDKRIKTTHAHQLALSVVYYSPLQTLFWYDKPSAYENEPEIEFFEKVPTVWNETKVIQGKPGEFITTARRSGNDWFVGIITNNDARTLQIPLSFLIKEKQYEATIYADDPSVSTKTKVSVKKSMVKAATTLNVKLDASGGQAIWLHALN